jgi:hypothetical protein
MLTIVRRLSIFTLKDVHLADYPLDVEGCDIVRFLYCKDEVDVDGFSRTESITSTIDLTQDLDTIWHNMKRDSCRRFINRAQRQAIKIRINEGYKEIQKMRVSFQQGKGFNPLFGITAISPEMMRRYGTLFIAEFEGQIIAGQHYLENDNIIVLKTSVSKRLEVDHEMARVIGDANHLLHWEVIKYAKNKGIREFDFGGLFSFADAEKDDKKNSINIFKLRFGGEIVPRYTYYKIYSRGCKVAYSLFKLANHWYKKREVE